MRAREQRREGPPPAARQALSAPTLQQAIGNRAFTTLLQRDTPPPAIQTAPAAPPDPAADEKKLLAESPTTDQEYASWVLRAADRGFASLHNDTRAALEALRDGKKTAKGHEASTTENKIGALKTLYELARGPMTRWAADTKTTKVAVTFGSFLRDKSGLHGGKAIDLPRGMGTGTEDAVVAILDDLSAGGTYGIGLPFSGDYFDPADQLSTKQAAAVAAAGEAGTPATVTGGLKLDVTGIYKTEWDAEKKAWKEPVNEKPGQAYTKLKSQKVKDQLAKMRKAGTTIILFPDRPGHVHVDRRG